MKALFFLVLLIPFQTHPILSMNLVPGLTPIKIFGLLTVVFGLKNWLSNKTKSKFTIISPLVLFFCMGQLLIGFVLHESLGANAVRSLISFTMFFFCITFLVDTEKKLKVVFIACLIGMAWSSLYMFKEYMQFRNVFNGFRPRGSFGDSNYYSIAALFVIPMGIALFKTNVGFKKIIYGIMTCLVIGGLLVGQSRGGLIGLCLLGWFYWINANKMFFATFRILIVALVIALALPNNFWIRIQKMNVKSTTEVSGDDLSNKRRVELPRAGYIMFLNNPLTGVGPGNYKKMSIKYNPILRDIGGPGIAHNTYVEILAEMGISGVICFFSIYAITIRNLKAIRRKSEVQSFAYESAIALRIALYGYLFAAFFLSAQYSKFYWLCVFLGIMMHKIYNPNQPKDLT